MQRRRKITSRIEEKLQARKCSGQAGVDATLSDERNKKKRSPSTPRRRATVDPKKLSLSTKGPKVKKQKKKPGPSPSEKKIALVNTKRFPRNAKQWVWPEKEENWEKFIHTEAGEKLLKLEDSFVHGRELSKNRIFIPLDHCPLQLDDYASISNKGRMQTSSVMDHSLFLLKSIFPDLVGELESCISRTSISALDNPNKSVVMFVWTLGPHFFGLINMGEVNEDGAHLLDSIQSRIMGKQMAQSLTRPRIC